MTQEEKARAYDEAVQLARNYYPDNEFLDTIFPELRESEDERIRKMLVAQMQRWNKMATEENVEQDIKDSSDALAWLEKQKDAIGAARQQGYEEGMEDGVSMVENAQKEQKPAEKQDYSGLSELERAIHRGFLAASVENVPVGIIKETAKDCITQIKPVEWSEEEKGILLECILALQNSSHWLLADKLSSLRPQPKQEWSKGDEENFKWFDKFFRAESVVAGGRDIPQDKYLWFKSLRPQPKVELTLLDENIIEAAVAFVEQNDHFNSWRGIDKRIVIKALRTLKPHWKPSEKQMKAILDAMTFATGDTLIYLNSLYEQLKAL